MKINPIVIPCFVLVIWACGCQENGSSSSDAVNSFGTTGANEAGQSTNIAASTEQNHSTVIAYYFHRTMRCHTCLAIETNAARVIESNFSRQITDGQIIWMPYNLDESGGKDLAKEFDISVSTLVLAKMQDGKHTKFRKLDNVWAYVGDPVKFDDYVKTEVEQFLSE